MWLNVKLGGWDLAFLYATSSQDLCSQLSAGKSVGFLHGPYQPDTRNNLLAGQPT